MLCTMLSAGGTKICKADTSQPLDRSGSSGTGCFAGGMHCFAHDIIKTEKYFL